MSINFWGKIIDKEKYNNNSRFRLNMWIEIGTLLIIKSIICLRIV